MWNHVNTKRRGMAIAWFAVSAVTMFGIGSFAMDFGRVTMAKSELQAAATAAARAAVMNLSSTTAAQNAAIATAATNFVDGQSVTLVAAEDIEFGSWNDGNNTFTVLTGLATSSANAVRVTARRTAARGNPIELVLSRCVGVSTCDVRASAVAKVSYIGFPFVGLDSVTLSGQGNTNSYNSASGAYNAGSAGSAGHVASNGNITLSGSGIVKGDARPGINGTVSKAPGASVTGSTTPLTARLAFGTPSVPAGAYNSGAVSLGGGTYNVNAGDYYCTSMTITNKATFNCLGPVRVFCSGAVNINGGYIGTYQNRPQNFQIYVTNNSSVSLNGQADFYGQIYAPLSDVTQGGQADIYGSIIAKNLTFGGTWKGGAHADSSLIFLGTPMIVTTK
jgi:hypothetical protein